MIILYSPSCSTPAPTLLGPLPLQGARARGDRVSITETDGVNGRHSSRPIGTGCPERASLVSVIGIRLVPSREPFIKEGLSTHNGRSQEKSGFRGDGGALVVGLAAVTRTLDDLPRRALLPGIFDKDGTPMQRHPEAVEIAEELGRLKQMAIRIVSRDGVIDANAFEFVELLNRLERRSYQRADDEAFALALLRVGRNSDRVKRLGRQLFPDHDDAA